MSRFIFLLIFLFGIHAAYAAEPLSPQLNGDMANLQILNQNLPLPQVVLTSADKGSQYLWDFKTNLIVLNIWATWCPPCIDELPSLNALQYAMGSNTFVVVNVSVESDAAVVKKYLADNKLTKLTSFIDAHQDLQHLDVLKDVPGVPITLIINPQMKVLAMLTGEADWNGPDARAVLEYYAKHVTYSPM
jgi:thiol-disulfide isomerase/thioredoxin